VALALAVVVLALGALLLVLAIGEAVFTIDARLDAHPAWIAALWWGGVGLIGLLGGLLVWRLLMPRRRPRKPGKGGEVPAAPTREEIETALAQARESGVDTRAVEHELAELEQRKEAGEVHVALFGEISTGKSSLVKALLPNAEIRSDVLGGTTRALHRYEWQSPSGDSLLITDMPGTEEAGGELDRLAREEAERAHIVVYVVDGDLNRRQHAALSALQSIGKPLILVLNKSDRYSQKESRLLAERLAERLQQHPLSVFVQTTAAAQRTVILQHPDGTESTETRPGVPDVSRLTRAIQRLIDDRPEILERLRDSATFVLAHRKLDEALTIARREQAEKIVDSYATKAVIGAMAAVAPGSDLIIQGWLGTQLVKDLTKLYDTQASKMDTELLLKLVQQHVGRAHTLLLAVAGNALKAFPGIGTLAGAALHAVAYGIIFRTLGRALAASLASRGEFHPRQTAKQFEETLGEDLESSARRVAQLVVEHAKRGKTQSDR
jgi:predicted GTPase